VPNAPTPPPHGPDPSASPDRVTGSPGPARWTSPSRARLHLVALSVIAAVVLAGCSSGAEVVDFGAPPPDDAPSVPADGGLDATAVDAPAEVPPPDADLFPGGWEEAAAWIVREAEAGRPTLVNIFASWCGPCEREMPMLIDAADATPEVAFLGIDHLDRLEDGRAFVDELGIPFATIHDIDGDVAFAVGARGMPTTVVFDTDGRLAGRVVGELTEASLAQLLDEVR
jgi:cytochrome c biogenesis protein CcmG, thiol:disulfide interchange protein DsbE